MTTDTTKIIYTITDEAPALATYSLLPIVEAFTKAADVAVATKDISLAARIIANFPEKLTEAQKQNDALTELGELAKTPEANIIKLPNISASIPQLVAAIKELQAHGYDLPDFPEEAKTEAEQSVKARYAKILGSAVNPVLREGNSDRRVAAPVKAYAQKNPHSMGDWSSESKSHVSHMEDGDFYSSEQSAVMPEASDVKIEYVGKDGSSQVLKAKTSLLAGEVVDSAVMNINALRAFFDKETEDAKEKDVLLSLHLKATMMKVSDPIMFGHAVTVFYKDVFEKHAAVFAELGVDADNGLGDVYAKIENLSAEQRDVIKADIMKVYESHPDLAMVDSDNGITNLHVPNDIIIDASMPAALRTSGMMWNPAGKLQDTKFMIPDRCYAGVYQAVVDFCRENGAFDVTTMGNVSNVGLMAQKAEEYGSHDKTFKAPGEGVIRVTDESGSTVFEQKVEQDDIFRMCQTKDAPIRDWVKLAVNRARATGSLTLFWLDANRAHDAQLIAKVNEYLKFHDTEGLDIRILPPVEACRLSMETIKAGKDAISVTGNVLRDYLTDLFPILELGTSAKMLSIVPLLAGGGLFETGAGGSAPKHVQQLVKENHLRWDSLGEFLALGVSLEDIAVKTENKKAQVLADALNAGIGKYLDENKSPSRRVNELDNRGSHFFLAQYWAVALAEQNEDQDLKASFADLARTLVENESQIVEELNSVQGVAVELGGYFQFDDAKAAVAMRPSATLNAAVDALR
ncbi:NADP-dependent isocitrate dehydrogenase [Endozoicomonas sp. OPT23]|uniref:NADP-dependent isocitrate dehydrogenase n=1 Tax=Endozoicomonas sp. OPT23 TaxID=2072845 RepID=UPI00129BF754|nr:NADP-dependent isocitrate dehydrogenase [Endozoicomonas sp. OPT23]MRI34352.1 NADP-dependent isocitrate dehydrogenase [Endozoicomonas sp. OPT23]